MPRDRALPRGREAHLHLAAVAALVLDARDELRLVGVGQKVVAPVVDQCHIEHRLAVGALGVAVAALDLEGGEVVLGDLDRLVAVESDAGHLIDERLPDGDVEDALAVVVAAGGRGIADAVLGRVRPADDRLHEREVRGIVPRRADRVHIRRRKEQARMLTLGRGLGRRGVRRRRHLGMALAAELAVGKAVHRVHRRLEFGLIARIIRRDTLLSAADRADLGVLAVARRRRLDGVVERVVVETVLTRRRDRLGLDFAALRAGEGLDPVFSAGRGGRDAPVVPLVFARRKIGRRVGRRVGRRGRRGFGPAAGREREKTAPDRKPEQEHQGNRFHKSCLRSLGFAEPIRLHGSLSCLLLYHFPCLFGKGSSPFSAWRSLQKSSAISATCHQKPRAGKGRGTRSRPFAPHATSAKTAARAPRRRRSSPGALGSCKGARGSPKTVSRGTRAVDRTGAFSVNARRRTVKNVFFKKGLLFQNRYAIILPLRKKRPVGQEAKTSPSHGENMGSIPVRVTILCLNRNT